MKKIKISKKIKYIIILFILFVLNAVAINSITNSRYKSSIEIKGIQEIGYAVLEVSLYNPNSVEGYDSGTNTFTIEPEESKTIQCKLTNLKNTYYNQMDLKCYLKILDETGNEPSNIITAQINGINGASYVANKGYGPIDIASDGVTSDEIIFNVNLTCTSNCISQENKKYYVIAEAYNEAAQNDETDTENGVIVRRRTEINLKTYGLYDINYELYGHANLPDGLPTTYELGDKITLKVPVSRTHNFLGWYDNSSFTGNAATTEYQGTYKDLTFYAKWQEKVMHNLTIQTIPNNVNIHYVSNEPEVGLNITLNNSSGFQEKFEEGTKINVSVSKENYETINTEITMGNADITKQIELRKLCAVSIAGVTDTSEDANIEYSINVPANSTYIAAKSESGTKTGNLSGTYPTGTIINVTVKKDGFEQAIKTYTVTDNISETITIRKLYALNIQGKAIAGGNETDATITYTINVPGSSSVSSQTITNSVTGNLTGNYPVGSTVSVTVSKDGFDSISKSYTMSTSGISETIKLLMNWTYTLTVTSPANANISYEIKSGKLISGSLTGTGTNTIVVQEGTELVWKASKSDVVDASGNIERYFSENNKVTVISDIADTVSLHMMTDDDVITVDWSKASLEVVRENGLNEHIKDYKDMSLNAVDNLLGYAQIEHAEVLTLRFNLAAKNIPTDAIIKKVCFRIIATNGANEVDTNVELWNNDEFNDEHIKKEHMYSYKKIDCTTPNLDRTKQIVWLDYGEGGIQYSKLDPENYVTVKVRNIDSKDSIVWQINVHGADITQIVYLPSPDSQLEEYANL